MMGSGKSTVGKLLSKKLNMKFSDVDSIIEEKLSLSVAQIFKAKGEGFFRKVEEKESIKLVKENGVVIALGGGAFLNEMIRDNIKKLCFSVWLDLNSDELFKRIKFNKKRPLLNSKKNKGDLKKLYEKRKKFYSLADCKIDCNSKSKNEIVEEIKKIYENT